MPAFRKRMAALMERLYTGHAHLPLDSFLLDEGDAMIEHTSKQVAHLSDLEPLKGGKWQAKLTKQYRKKGCACRKHWVERT